MRMMVILLTIYISINVIKLISSISTASSIAKNVYTLYTTFMKKPFSQLMAVHNVVTSSIEKNDCNDSLNYKLHN